VKFLSRLLTALNLLPSMATLAFVRKAYLSANGDELCAYLAYRRPIILAETGNRLVIRNQPTGEPHHLNIAPALALKPAARLNPIEITIDGVNLELSICFPECPGELPEARAMPALTFGPKSGHGLAW
jgi:hypothetical protein